MFFHVGVHALILDERNKVLITKRSATDDYMPLLWDIPGGSVDMGEMVEDALVREVKEETNMSIIPIKPIYVHTELSHLPKAQLIQIVYKCAYIGGSIILDTQEHDEYQWVEYYDIGKYNCIAFLENLLRNYDINERRCLRG